MNVAFFGTSNRSIPILEALKDNYNLVLCVTKKDVRVGRKQIIKQTEVKKWAIENEIEYIEIDSLKGQNLAIVKDSLIKMDVALGVVADFVFIIPGDIFSTLQHGMINVHFSLLPRYRGASPVQQTIINGDEITGITFMLVDAGLDTGKIIYQIEYKLTGKENSENLYQKLFKLAGENLPKVLDQYLSGNILPHNQDESCTTYTYSPSHPKSTYIFKEDAHIDWQEDLALTERKIRAYYPWPIAWTTLGEMQTAKLVVTDEGITSPDNVPLEQMRLFESDKDTQLRIKIYSAKYENKTLKINTMQVEGKNKIEWRDFLNGYMSK